MLLWALLDNTSQRPMATAASLTDRRELGARYADHAQFADLASPSQIEHGQSDNANFLVRARSTTANAIIV